MLSSLVLGTKQVKIYNLIKKPARRKKPNVAKIADLKKKKIHQIDNKKFSSHCSFCFLGLSILPSYLARANTKSRESIILATKLHVPG